MSKKRDERLTELAYTIADHQARIEKLGVKWAAELVEKLDATEKRLLDEITSFAEKHKRGLTSATALSDLSRLERKIAKIRNAAFAEAQQQTLDEAFELYENEQNWAKKLTKTLEPESAGALSVLPAKAVKENLANMMISNMTAAEWFSGTAEADVSRIVDAVREGVRSGWTIPELTRKIMGTKANDYTDGIIETSRKHATTMARTLCGGIANNAKDAFYRENDDVVIGVEWLDTLDSRTCSRCGGLSRKRWKTKEPHPVPPLHHACRCVLIPVTELTDLGEDVPRPAANADFDAEAKELYEKKYPGKKFEDLAASTRHKYYYEAQKAYTERTGEPPYRQVPGNMTFAEYFQAMPENEKLRYLGPGKYELYKKGNLPLEKFIPPYPERTYTVAELKEMDKKSFRKKKTRSVPVSPKAKPEKTKEQLHKEHLEHRREQEKRAFENRLRKWQKTVEKNKGSQSLIDAMEKEYTLDVAKACGKPPAIKITKKRKNTYYHPDSDPQRRYIKIHIDPDDWYGYPDTTFVHEFAHWKHDMALLRKKITPVDVKTMADIDAQKIRDWVDLQMKAKDQSDFWLFKRSPAEYFSRKIFGKGYWDIEDRDRFIAAAYADIVGDLTNGEYGAGHTISYYKKTNNSSMRHCEAIANIKLTKKYGKNIGAQFDFDNIWSILKLIGV